MGLLLILYFCRLEKLRKLRKLRKLLSVPTSAAGAIDLSVPLRAGTGVGAQIVNTVSYSLTWSSLLYTFIHIWDVDT